MTKINRPQSTNTPKVPPSILLSQSDIVVFDMDGTLYLLDGENNGYKNSTLNKTVLANTRKLIMNKEGVAEDIAQDIIDKIFADKKYLSIELGKRYKMSKSAVFDITWDIDPEGILSDYENAQKVVKKISRTGKLLILLTSAPRIWQEKVIDYLDLKGCFGDIYNGNQVTEKGEFFLSFLEKYPQKKILSIGDQLDSDIIPAISLGMLGFHVNHPKDLLLLTQI